MDIFIMQKNHMLRYLVVINEGDVYNFKNEKCKFN